MKNYYIGMHGHFDEVKYIKDFTDHISGIEICNFNDMEEVNKVVDLSKTKGFKIGIHFPLLKSSYKYRDPQVTTMDESEKRDAFEALEKELAIAKDIDAAYLLIHFPKPMILDTVTDWTLLPYQPQDGISEAMLERDTFIEACKVTMKALNRLSKAYDIPIVLEMEFVNKWFYDEEWFIEALKENKALTICLDFSRIHFQDYMDQAFNVEGFIGKLSPYTTGLHVANLQVDGVLGKRHYPAFAHLSKTDGWADIGAYIAYLKDKGKLENILFEHKSENVTREELVGCYEWIAKLIEE